jgi:hypothetical protein
VVRGLQKEENKKMIKMGRKKLSDQGGMKLPARTPCSVTGGPAINPFGLADRRPLFFLPIFLISAWALETNTHH